MKIVIFVLFVNLLHAQTHFTETKPPLRCNTFLMERIDEPSQRGFNFMDTSVIEGETWKDVVGWQNEYKISSLGRVRGLVSNIQPNYLKFFLNKVGYPTVTLQCNGKKKNITIHRLVAIAFIPNPENKKEVNHLNGIKTDPRAINLEWCTRSENAIHSLANGLSSCFGNTHYRAKLTDAAVVDILTSNELQKDLAIKYGVCVGTIEKVVARKVWKHIKI